MEQGSRRQPSSGGRRVEGGSRRSSRDGAGQWRECGVQSVDAVSVLPKCRGFHRKVIRLWRLGLYSDNIRYMQVGYIRYLTGLSDIRRISMILHS